MLIAFVLSQTGVILRVKVLNAGATNGAGLTGLTSASAGLRIAAIADVEAAPVAYTGANLETIAALGTYAAPTAGKARFRELDATNHPGVYEIQLDNARFAVANAKHALISVSGVASMAETDAVIPLTRFDPYDGVRGALTALPNSAANAANGLITNGTNAGQLSVSTGRANADVLYFGGVAGTFAGGRPEVNASHAGGTVWGAGAITAGSIAAGALNGKGDWATVGAAMTLGAGAIGAGQIAAGALNGKGDWSTAGAAMTLTVGERTAVANEVENQIIDETDSEKVLTAITNKIAAVNPSLGGLTIAAIAAGVRDVLIAGATANSLGDFISTIKTVADAVKAKTDLIPANPAQTADVLSRLSAAAYVAPDNASIGNALTAAEGAQAAANAVAAALPVRFSQMKIDLDGFVECDPYVMEFSIADGTMTVRRADGVAVKYTRTLASDGAALPVVGSDAP